MGYKIGVDIGVASVGTAVVNSDGEILEATSSLFNESNAAENEKRRNFRGGRRQKRRQKNRIDDFKKMWTTYGYTIPENNVVDIVRLRNRALTEKISMDELYNILVYMLKHRGISYLDDAIDEEHNSSAYSKGILLNQKELKSKYPCEVQLERLEKYGQYRGDAIIEEDGEMEYHSNVFTIASYRNELEKIFDTQKEYNHELNSEFVDKYMVIFNRKREYYIGPGNEKSRTDYGVYTTKLGADGKYKTDKNIFEKLIGKCSVYPEEYRAAGASYTAQEFNLLNDLNNLKINNRKLSENEKIEIVDIVKKSNSVKMQSIIKKVIKEDIEQFSGARIDRKTDKETFHTFAIYRKMRKNLEMVDCNIDNFSRKELDTIADILTLNTETSGIISAFNETQFDFEPKIIEQLIQFRKKNSSLFSKWQSLSYKAMKELIPQMYREPKEQMQLLTEMGVFAANGQKYKGYNYIPEEELIKDIYNPVVVRSVRMTVKMLNQIIKKYGYPETIVIEMPRDKNSEDEKKRITDYQKKNEKEYGKILDKIREEYGIEISSLDYKKQEQLPLKLKLWNEQDGKCLYSGKKIDIEQILKEPYLFQIDHIIPKSISFNDSRDNKVLVYESENQQKGNKTPYMYLQGKIGNWNWEAYKSYVLSLKNRKLITEKKTGNLLFMQDINKIDVVKGFINRNLNDTRYASRIILNELQAFFSAKEDCNTKIKVIRGSFTNQMRNNLRIKKDRDESYSHHAVDAMLLAFSQMGYEAYRKIQEECYDFETGEILNLEKWNECVDDEKYDQIVYNTKFLEVRKRILAAEKDVKYHHKVDRKCNRGLCNQTIYGTREREGETYKIRSFNIYTDECKSLIKLIKNGKESDLLMYNNDRKTYDDMLKIIEMYKDEKNPFVAYNKETGDFFRKYSKKHNGPKIEKVKYYKEKVESCIDISHKYGHTQGSRKVILGNLNPYRTDVFYSEQKKQYYLIGVKYNHIKCVKNRYMIDKEAYSKLLRNAGAIGMNEGLDDAWKAGVEYKFSFYKDDIVKYEHKGQYYVERFLSRTDDKIKNKIEIKPIDKPRFEEKNKEGKLIDKRKIVTLGKTKYIGKLVTDVLGNVYSVEKEKFSLYIDN